MTVENTTTKLNTIITGEYKKPDTVLNVASNDNWLLSITARYSKDALTVVENRMTTEDVLSGNVQKEIEKIQSEEDQIAAVLKENTTSLNSVKENVLMTSLRSSTAKTIGFVAYSGTSKIKATTDTTAIKNSIVANTAEEKQLISDAIDLLCDWLDDYIVNHRDRITEGKRNGHCELEQTFLLEVRKAIENFDFPVGFGSVGNSPSDDFTPDSNTLGAYSFAATDASGNSLGYDTYHLNTSRSMILNPTYFMPERPYNSLSELQAAVAAGTATYSTGVEFLVDDEAYNNYCKNYIASTLFHEIIHSTHIYNEAVTYYATDAFDDDWARKDIEGVSAEVEAYIASLGDMTLNYADGTSITVSFSDGLQYHDVLISHNLTGFSHAVNHGYKMMQANNGAFSVLMPGYNTTMCKKELENFAITA